MRIINNHNLNNLKEVKLSKLGNVKIGDLLDAKIVEVSDNKVIADIKGKLVLLNNLIELDLVEGQNLELEVASQKNGKVYARPTNITFKQELNLEMLSHELKDLGLEASDKNIKVLNFFKENNVLFNKTELKEVLDNIKFIEKLVDQIEKGNVDLKALDINNNLREELVKIITSNFSKEMPETQKPLPQEALPKETIDILKVLLQAKDNIKTQGEELTMKEPIKEALDVAPVIDENLVNEKTQGEVIEKFQGKVMDLLGDVLSSELKGLELDAILFLVKEKFDVNLSNLLLSDQFFSEGKTIGESLENIVEILTESPSETIDMTAFKSVFEEVMSLETLVSHEVDEIIEDFFGKSLGEMNEEEKTMFKTIKDELVFIKRTNDFNLELNDKINYYQFNLQQNKKFSGVEFFVNKESQKNKKNKQKFKIFVSLQTKNLERVKAILNLNRKKLDITFVTNKKAYENKLKSKITTLESVIESIGFSSVNINFMQKDGHSHKKDLLLDVVASKIDMKV